MSQMSTNERGVVDPVPLMVVRLIKQMIVQNWMIENVITI